MWAPHQTPEPVEKVKPPKWTAENTAETQAVVNRLAEAIVAVEAVCGHNTEIAHAMAAALRRFQCLDPQIDVPWRHQG